jgi:hypothetical protein
MLLRHMKATPKAGCPMHDNVIVMRGFIERQVDPLLKPRKAA